MRNLMKTLNGMEIVKPQDIQDEFARLMDRPFEHVLGHLNVSSKLRVTEDEKRILVKADVPGFQTKDVHVRIEQGFLLIYGKKGYQHKSERKNMYSYELTTREFSHCLGLAKTADTKNMTIEVKNGRLEILIPQK
jgi:HSP20 family protein